MVTIPFHCISLLMVCLLLFMCYHCHIIDVPLLIFSSLNVCPLEVRRMEDAGGWDLSQIREEEFDSLAVYLVRDQHCDPDEENRAEASLPRNLVLKASPSLGDVSNFSPH